MIKLANILAGVLSMGMLGVKVISPADATPPTPVPV